MKVFNLLLIFLILLQTIFMATTVKGRDGHISEAIPIEKTVEILKKVSFF